MVLRTSYLGLGLLVLVSAYCFAGDSDMDRATLRGLKAVKVVVEPPSADLQQAGVDPERLRLNIEKKLQNAGVPVNNDAGEFLGVTVGSVRGGRRGPVSVAVNVGVYQVVTLTRDKNMKTVAETWGDQRVMSAGTKNLDQAVASVVDELADEFVTAYRSVNPRS